MRVQRGGALGVCFEEDRGGHLEESALFAHRGSPE